MIYSTVMEKKAVSKSGVKSKFTSFFFLDKLIKITVFLTQTISCWQQNADAKVI